jgi:hypothetical protein
MLKGKGAGLIIALFSIMAGLVMYFKPWQLIRKNDGAVKFNGTALFATNTKGFPAFLAVSGVAFSVFATMIVKDSPSISLWLYMASGLLILFAKPANEKLFDFCEVPERAAPLQKWEPWFVLVLFIVTAWLRLYDLADIPPVGGGNEGLIMANCGLLSAKGAAYVPHIGGGTDWPTFTYYIGLFFSNFFGWDIANLRISSAIFGIISVITLYFLIRRLTSPVSAALSSLLYSVFLFHIIISRLFAPMASLLFIPHILCLALLLTAIKKPSWYLYLAAGLACGYSLEGYVPGRGVFLLFIGWFILMFITRQKLFHKASNFFLFWGGLILVASPVIYFAIRHPDQYWGYVKSVNPNRTAGIKAYIDMMLANIPQYAGMFFTKTSADSFYHFPLHPIIDNLTCVLFASGFFLCIFSFWKPLSSVLLILFCGSMIPGMIGGGSSTHPTAGRTLMAFPVVFAMCAFSFERIRRALAQNANKGFYAAAMSAAIIVVLFFFQYDFREFFRWSNNPIMLVTQDHELYFMGKGLRKYQNATVYVTPFFVSTDATIVYIPQGRVITAKKDVDEMLIFDKQNDYFLCLDPFYTDETGIFKKYFPDSVINTYRESNVAENDAYFESLKLPSYIRRNTDKYAPHIYASTIYIPKKDVVDFQTMLYTGSGASGMRVKVFGGSDFAAQYSDKKMSLRGGVIITDVDVNNSKNIEPVTFSMPWKGWRLTVDNKTRAFGEKVSIDGGLHFFEISGTVSAGLKGDLPLKIMQGKINIAEKGQVVAVDEKFGVHEFCIPGPDNWDKPYAYSHRLTGPNTKLYDATAMTMPFSLKETAIMTVPVGGDYYITGNAENKSKIVVDGVVVFENIRDAGKITSRKINLLKNRPVRVEVYQNVDAVPIGLRAVSILIKGPGMDKPILAPYYWFYPDD